MRRSALFLLSSLLALPALAATPPADPKIPEGAYVPVEPGVAKSDTGIAQSRGGAIRVRWNRELLADLGLANLQPLGKYTSENERGFDLPLAKDSQFRIDGTRQMIYSMVSGSGSWLGGFRLSGPNGTIQLENPTFRLQSNPLRIDLVSADGRVDVYIDQVMYEFVDGGRQFRIRSADLRLSAAGAARIGHPDQAGLALAEVRALAPMYVMAKALEPTSCADPNWPGKAVPGGGGLTYQADVFMQTFNSGSNANKPAEYKRCRNCDGPGGALDGEVVFAPSSTLRNNVNNGTAAATVSGDVLGTSAVLNAAMVSWYPMFSTSPWSYPYPGSDQHPYLIWNLYRINANGGIEQVGRSGVKHAFLTTNQGCASGENCSGNILGRACGDTYGTGNNDSSSDLGPRSEIIPAKGQWGRCGSIFDPDCNNVENASGNTSFDQRLLVRESAIDQAANPGASWLFESWYIVRDDVNIYNTMGTRPFTATYGGGVWTAGDSAAMKLGSAIDRWNETPGAFASNLSELSVPGGHTKVAVRVTDLGNGTWRYNYAVMNFDFAREATQGAEPSLRVLRNYGFKRFSVPLLGGNVLSREFSDGDSNAANDWTAPLTPDPLAVEWVAPADSASLNWGTLFRFTVVSDSPPSPGQATLEVTEPGTPQTYSTDALAVGLPTLFQDGFEN